MSIKIIEGNPGSGKSYYGVRHLLKNFYKLKNGFYQLEKNIVLITNMEELQVPHVDLRDEISAAGGVYVFFSLEYQEEYRHCSRWEGKSIVYMIDEAQMLLRGSKKELADVFSYFEYHRHFGQDIYLLTQNVKKIPSDISCLSENVIRARPRMRSLTGELHYTWLCDGSSVKTETFRLEPAVCAVYQSSEKKETEKVKNPMVKTILLTLGACVCVFFFAFSYLTKSFLSGSAEASPVPSASPIQNNVINKNESVAMIPEKEMQPEVVIDPVYDYLVQLPKISTFDKNKETISFIFANDIILLNSMPYPVVKIKKDWFVVLDEYMFNHYYGESEKLPTYRLRARK